MSYGISKAALERLTVDAPTTMTSGIVKRSPTPFIDTLETAKLQGGCSILNMTDVFL